MAERIFNTMRTATTVGSGLHSIVATTRRAIVLLSIVVASASGAEKNPAATAPAATEYRIKASDLLDINVYRETDLCVKVRVGQTGNVNFPLLGSVAIAGLTASEAQDKLTKLLGKDYLVDPRVTVTVESSSSQRVIIFGQVKTPGTYDIPSTEPLTVLQLVARAGGFTEIAATDKVTVIRGEGAKQKKFTVNINAIIKGGDKNKDVALEPGDLVSVPETMF